MLKFSNRTTEFGGYEPINLLLNPYIEILNTPLREIDDHSSYVEEGIINLYFLE